MKTPIFSTGAAIVLMAPLVGVFGAAAPGTSPGSLDTGFGIKGKVTTLFAGGPDSAHSLALQGDSKIVVAGTARVSATGYDNDFALARYTTNGTLDTSFGNGGKVTTDFGGYDLGMSTELQPDGRIVVAGTLFEITNGSLIGKAFALARYNPDGSLDVTFGTGGKVTTELPGGTNEQALAVAVQPDASILVAGWVFNGSTKDYDFALVRYTTLGTLDITFGGGTGIVTTDFASSTDRAFALALQSDGRIVVVGSSGVSDTDFALARYNPDGSLDATFGGSGKVTTDFYGSFDGAGAVAVQPDGQIVAAGNAFNSVTRYDFALARFNGIDGSLDTTFGSGGKVTTDFKRRGEDRGRGLSLQSDGKIVVVGGARGGGDPAYGYNDFALARYDSNGVLDSGFGNGGKVTTDFNNGDDFAVDVAIQLPDGKILAAGYATLNTRTGTTAFALARYLP